MSSEVEVEVGVEEAGKLESAASLVVEAVIVPFLQFEGGDPLPFTKLTAAHYASRISIHRVFKGI